MCINITESLLFDNQIVTEILRVKIVSFETAKPPLQENKQSLRTTCCFSTIQNKTQLFDYQTIATLIF